MKRIGPFVLFFLLSQYVNASVEAPKPWEQLEARAFDPGLSVEERWSSMMKLSSLSSENVKPIFVRAAESGEWLMKSAALVALRHSDEKEAVSWARKLLNDRAMMVRISAVKVLSELKSKEAVPELWEALYNPVNFHNGQSLPARRAISRTLAQLSDRKEDWEKLSRDKDPYLQKLAQTKLAGLVPAEAGNQEKNQ